MPELLFAVSVAIRHPFIDPRSITDEFGHVPFQSWQAGGIRSTPFGGAMPGVARDSYWVHRREVRGERDFFKAVTEAVAWLEGGRVFLAGIDAEGGRVAVRVQLPGDANIGAVLDWTVLARLAALRVDLDVEVFPEFG